MHVTITSISTDVYRILPILTYTKYLQRCPVLSISGFFLTVNSIEAKSYLRILCYIYFALRCRNNYNYVSRLCVPMSGCVVLNSSYTIVSGNEATGAARSSLCIQVSADISITQRHEKHLYSGAGHPSFD